MILGVGIDVIEISRIEKTFERRGERFKQKIFHEIERAYCERMPQPLLHYAARFAAKEAFSKAVGLGMTEGIRWADIYIENDARGAPHLRLAGRAAQHAADRGMRAVHVSLSHSHTVAAAAVVLEGETLTRGSIEPQAQNPT